MASEPQEDGTKAGPAGWSLPRVDDLSDARAQLTVGLILLVGFLTSLAVAWESRSAFFTEAEARYQVTAELLLERIWTRINNARGLVRRELEGTALIETVPDTFFNGVEVEPDPYSGLVAGLLLKGYPYAEGSPTKPSHQMWGPDLSDQIGASVLGLLSGKTIRALAPDMPAAGLPGVMPLTAEENDMIGIDNGVLISMPFSQSAESDEAQTLFLVFDAEKLIAQALNRVDLTAIIVDFVAADAEGNRWNISNRPDLVQQVFGARAREGSWVSWKPTRREASLGWQVNVAGSPGQDSAQVLRAIVIFAIGMALTILAATFFWAQNRRTQRITEVIERRTRALRQAQEDLAGQNDLLRSLNTDLQLAQEEAEAASKSKSEFLATISHELRTPLNAILGFSQILGDQDLGDLGDERYVDYARNINDSGTHLLSLINDILDLAKLESGRLTIDSHSVSPYQLVDKVGMFLGSEASSKGVDLRIEVSDEMPSSLMGDMLRLRQILINLAANAVKFTEKGFVSVRLAPEPLQDGSPGWIMCVQDTGPGIPPEKLDTLFERFTQVDGALSRQHGGVGLGLAICRELSLRMGGSIDVESAEGVGTKIWVHLPLEDALGEDDVEDGMI